MDDSSSNEVEEENMQLNTPDLIVTIERLNTIFDEFSLKIYWVDIPELAVIIPLGTSWY